MTSRTSTAHTTILLNWDMNFNNENLTNDFRFSNAAANIPWPGFTAQTAAADASLMDANHFAPDIAMGQNFDWSWMGNNGQQTAWSGI